MGDSVKNVMERELFWGLWKDNVKNKCFNFERPSIPKIKERCDAFKKKRDIKASDKQKL
jgi:hypothetical protein